MDVVHKIRAFGLVRHIIMALCLLSFYAPSASQAKDRKLLISSFEDIVVEGDLIVNIITGKSPSAIACGDREAIDSLRMSQSGDQLTLTQANTTYSNNTARNSGPLSITITNRSLRNITMRGSGQLTVNELRQTGNSRIKLFGSGQITITRVTIGAMDVAISGNARLSIGSGKVRDATVAIDGSGGYIAAMVDHNMLSLSQNGGAETIANVLDRASINNNGAGNVTITGKGKCDISRAGIGSIKCANLANKR
jgi:Putative auto-transporter adhesin, head GIN domain